MSTAKERDPWPGILLICIALGFLFLVGAAAATKLRPDPQPQGTASRPGEPDVVFVEKHNSRGCDDAVRLAVGGGADFQPPELVRLLRLAARLAVQGPIAAKAAPLATRKTAFASRQAEVVAG